MKLFITNKKDFEKAFLKDLGNNTLPESYEVHQIAFKELMTNVADNSIPITINVVTEYEQLIMFEFVKLMDTVYCYKFTGIV